LFFNQLFEVHLPQARYLLLDPKRRATYDGHLNVFHEDQEKETVIQKALEKSDSPAAKEIQQQDFESAVIEENLSPEELAERRTRLWSLWQESCKGLTIRSRKLTFSIPEIQARKVERDEFMQRVLVEVRQDDQRRAKKKSVGVRKKRRHDWLKNSACATKRWDVARRTRFREAVENLTATARLYWAFGAAGGICCLASPCCSCWMSTTRCATASPSETPTLFALSVSGSPQCFVAWVHGVVPCMARTRMKKTRATTP
jgi:hypothetical protein